MPDCEAIIESSVELPLCLVCINNAVADPPLGTTPRLS